MPTPEHDRPLTAPSPYAPFPDTPGPDAPSAHAPSAYAPSPCAPGPYAPSPPVADPGRATAALVAAIVSPFAGLCVGGLLGAFALAVAALAFGIHVLRRTSDRGAPGRGRAVAAVAISGVQIAAPLLLLGSLLVVFGAGGWT